MPSLSKKPTRRARSLAGAVALASLLIPQAGRADPICAPITVASLTIGAVDCAKAGVWSDLKASGQFPDEFAVAGKLATICYKATAPATAHIGPVSVKIVSSSSSWTTDFRPAPLGGADNLGTVITMLNISDLFNHPIAQIFTRDIVDLSQFGKPGASLASSEDDVVVGGTGALQGVRGSYRILAVPTDATLATVNLTELTGEVCLPGF